MRLALALTCVLSATVIAQNGTVPSSSAASDTDRAASAQADSAPPSSTKVVPSPEPAASAVQNSAPPQPAPPSSQGSGQTPNGAGSAGDARPSFAEWLQGVKAEALARGIRAEIVEQALAQVEEPVPVVIERDRSQAEIVLPLETYLSSRLTTKLIATGRAMFGQNKATLDNVAEQYGVPAAIVAAVWGVESNFGRFSGVRPTVGALATLAWDPRRSALFRGELFDALEILDRGDIDLPRMKGSWAGAMGQPQFMPSSYLQYAADFDGDGRRDIWTSTGDVFASIANYLRGHGWVGGSTWGREVRVPEEAATHIATEVARRAGTCQATRDMSIALPLSEWQKLGVRNMNGAALPKTDQLASLVGGTNRHFLVYSNYDALLQYNCAHAYALTVGLLADRLVAPLRPSARPAPRRVPAGAASSPASSR